VAVAVPDHQDRQVTACARQVSLVCGHSMYAMDDDNSYSTLANGIIQML